MTDNRIDHLACLFTEKDMEDWLDQEENGTILWQRFVNRHIDRRARVMCLFCDKVQPVSAITRHLSMTLFNRNGKGGDGYRHGSRSDPDAPNANIYRIKEWA